MTTTARFRAQARHVSLLAVTRVGAAALGLIQLGVLTRVLPAAQFAVFATAIAVSTYVQLLGEPAILGYERTGHHAHSADLSKGGPRAAARSVLAVFFVALLPIAIAWGMYGGSPELTIATVTWAASLVQVRWSSIQFLNWNQQSRYGMLLLGNSGARTCAVAIAAFASHDAATALLAGALGSIVSVLVIGPRGGAWKPSRNAIRTVLTIGIPMALASLASTSLISWPTVAASRIFAPTVFAAYAAQVNLANAVVGLTIGFILIFGFPLAKREWDTGRITEAEVTTRRYFKYVATLGPLLCLLSWLFGQKLTELLLGSPYAGRAVPTAIVAVGCLNGIFLIRSWDLRLAFRQRLVAGLMIAAALLQIPLVWLAASSWGVGGLLIAYGTVYALLAAVANLCTHSSVRRPAFLLGFVLWMLILTIGATATQLPSADMV